MRNPFEDFLTSEVKIVKRTGAVLGPFKADVQGEIIYLFEVKTPIESGDTVLRELPNGAKESYTVQNAEFQEAFHAIPACYDLHVRKDDDRRRDQVLTSLNVFNVKGDFSRVNYQSHDNSVNVQRAETVFDSAKQALRDGVPDQVTLNDLLDKLDAVEKAKSKSGWGEAYGKFIQSAANHMAVIGPFLPALAETMARLYG
jgi:hypothetical protein